MKKILLLVVTLFCNYNVNADPIEIFTHHLIVPTHAQLYVEDEPLDLGLGNPQIQNNSVMIDPDFHNTTEALELRINDNYRFLLILSDTLPNGFLLIEKNNLGYYMEIKAGTTQNLLINNIVIQPQGTNVRKLVGINTVQYQGINICNIIVDVDGSPVQVQFPN